jgi:hypothetical protein
MSSSGSSLKMSGGTSSRSGDELDHPQHVVVERVVGIGIVAGMTADLLDVLAVVLPGGGSRRPLRAERGRHEDRHETVLHEVGSWTMSGRRRLRAENVVNQKPGRSSSVMAAPPTR